MRYSLRLRELRAKCGITQKELSELSNIDQSYISELETNPAAKSPSLKIVLRLAKALNVCPHQLIRSSTECKYNCANKCKQKFF